MSNSGRPHVALLPSAGMGHLTPFCRLAALLSSRGGGDLDVSFITAEPTVSLKEYLQIRDLLSSFPSIKSHRFKVPELSPSQFPSSPDPFFQQWESIRRCAHLLPPLLASATALIIDTASASAVLPVAKQLNIPAYILFTSSASMLSLVAHFPSHVISSTSPSAPLMSNILIPGLKHPVPAAWVPPPLHVPGHIFSTLTVDNGRCLPEADGVIINTFDALEPEVLAALNGGRVAHGLPRVFAVGPLVAPPPPQQMEETGGGDYPIAWLDRQRDKSVVYVSFGSRTAMSPEQIRELAAGLERSGCSFLWVIKTKKVDRDEEETDLGALLGEGYVERVKGRGLVVNGWVEQEEILRHRAVGGFVSHCGWNSVTEAAVAGVRVLCWPRMGDQRLNAEVVRRSGVGVWMEEWSWEAEGGVVGGEEIGRRVKEMMEDEGLRDSAERVAEEARVALGVGGTSSKEMEEFISRIMMGS
uniref:Glycosyltransferase n=1 Tax=Aloe vera TaxID=34199 RepID=A0A7G9P699_ALOVR|nr:C-glycosyltransferase [Aloe vera]